MRHLDVELPAHRNRRALTARCGRSKQSRRRGESRQRPPAGTPSTTRPEQPIDTRFPRQQSPRGTSSRSSTATSASSSAPSPSCGATRPSSLAARPADGACANAGLIKAGPTGGATMHQVELSVGFVLRVPLDDSRDTLLHELAHAIVGPRPRTRCRVADGRAAHRRHGEALHHRHAQPEALDGGVPRCRDQWFRPQSDGSARWPPAPSKRPSADPRRPRGRPALSAHPPAPVDDTPRGCLQQRATTHRRPRPFRSGSSPAHP